MAEPGTDHSTFATKAQQKARDEESEAGGQTVRSLFLALRMMARRKSLPVDVTEPMASSSARPLRERRMAIEIVQEAQPRNPPMKARQPKGSQSH